MGGRTDGPPQTRAAEIASELALTRQGGSGPPGNEMPPRPPVPLSPRGEQPLACTQETAAARTQPSGLTKTRRVANGLGGSRLRSWTVRKTRPRARSGRRPLGHGAGLVSGDTGPRTRCCGAEARAAGGGLTRPPASGRRAFAETSLHRGRRSGLGTLRVRGRVGVGRGDGNRGRSTMSSAFSAFT